MKLKTGLFQWLRRHYRRLRCYTSIEDCPVVTWFKIHETGNLSLLKKELNFSWYKNLYVSFVGLFINLDKVWSGIIDEFLKEIGHSKEHKKYLDLLKAYALQNCESVINPTPYNKVLANINKAKLDEENKKKLNDTKVEYMKLIDAISTAKHYPMWKVSVVEFYAALNNLNNGK